MRKILLLLTAILFISCTQVQKTTYHQTEEQNQEAKTLIIFYDKDYISLEKLRRKVKSYGASVVYEYKVLKGIAVRIPKNKSVEESKSYFKKIKGVEDVLEDGKAELH